MRTVIPDEACGYGSEPSSAIGSNPADIPPRHGRTHNLPVATTLPAAVPAIAVAGYAGILVAFWLSFAGNVEAALAIAVSTAYAAMYFGVPYLMVRLAEKHDGAPHRQSLHSFLSGEFETITGRIGGWAAVIQVVLVPVGLAFGALAIGMIYVSSL